MDIFERSSRRVRRLQPHRGSLILVAGALLLVWRSDCGFAARPHGILNPPSVHRDCVARAAGRVEGDEFKAARDRIRRIQLGLGPNDLLPPEAGEAEEPATRPATGPDSDAAPPVGPDAPHGQLEKDLDLAEAGAAPAAAAVAVSGDVAVTEAQEMVEVEDAYSGELKNMKELQPDAPKTGGPNVIQALITDLGLVTLPPPGEVAQTFGIVLLLVFLYTGFVALVDFGSQKVLGQVFSEFYQAARPEAPAL